jgi:hypothetical protein
MKLKAALKNAYFTLACVLSFSVCQPLIADNSIELKPKLCIKKKVTDFCDISVDIKWQTIQTNHHCVRNTSVNKEIACWQNSSRGAATDQAHTKVDLVYALLNTENDKVLNTQVLNILSLKDDSQNNSRRRRHVWSLF